MNNIQNDLSLRIALNIQDERVQDVRGIHYLENIEIPLRSGGGITVPNQFAPVVNDGRFSGIVDPLRNTLISAISGERRPQEEANVRYNVGTGISLRVSAQIENEADNTVHYRELSELNLGPNGRARVVNSAQNINDGTFSEIINPLRNSLLGTLEEIIHRHPDAVDNDVQEPAVQQLPGFVFVMEEPQIDPNQPLIAPAA